MSANSEVLERAHDQADWSGGKPPLKASYGKLMMWYFLLSDAFTFGGFLIAYGALRLSSETWPVPDFVFSTTPFGGTEMPLIFVTIMSFLLIASSVTMVMAVNEGKRENQKGVVFWLLMTIIGGAGFLSCQAWEWNNLIVHENMTITENPFGTHVESGTYLEGPEKDSHFEKGDSYLIHKHDGHWDQLKYKTDDGVEKRLSFGPKLFGALFFFITGFHGFHVLSGVIFLLIIAMNSASGIYKDRKNKYEMVEKIGLYWHFVDLVCVFVFLVFYLL